MIAIETRDLTKEFDGLVAVDGLDMEVHSGEIFRMGLLMYGKRPSLSEIIRALRQA